jgi:hypothetical protein
MMQLTRLPDRTLTGLLVLSGLIGASPSSAQIQPPANVHWAYSAFFGTGWYSVEGDRDVFILRLTPEWELSESSLENGERQLGWYLRLPVSTGLDQFDVDELIEAVDLDNVSFLSINSTLEVEVPVNDVWALRPYASIGYGQVLNSSEYAWTYWAGIKSRVTLHAGPTSTWHLINQVGYVGYTPGKGKDDSFWPAMAGLEVSHPVGRTADGSRRWLLHWKVGYTYFGDDVIFSRAPSAGQDITDEWEVGAGYGRRDGRIKIWFLSFDRLGIDYRTSSNGALSGITFFFRSAFER